MLVFIADWSHCPTRNCPRRKSLEAGRAEGSLGQVRAEEIEPIMSPARKRGVLTFGQYARMTVDHAGTAAVFHRQFIGHLAFEPRMGRNRESSLKDG